ncbi:putative CRAL-TRIO lipid binding domain-containing protein [Helianthus annuus]|nr:putative CRAL-TRIO lipid binding domain-containing protein [Helianthus annuus]
MVIDTGFEFSSKVIFMSPPLKTKSFRGCDMMGERETVRFFQSNKKLELRISHIQDQPKSRLFGFTANKYSKKTVKCVPPMKVSLVATGKAGDIGVFLLKTAALEIVRRFSSVHCPLIWRGLQALQIFCCPPFKWIQKWAPFTSLVKGMQVLSKPLLFLSVATCLFDESGSSKGTLSGSSAELTELSSQLATQDIRPGNKISRSVGMEDWLLKLYAELDKQGITIPARMDVDELRRFYDVSDGDFSRFLSSVKKTILWRQKYHLYSPQELEAWVNMVFWHGSDVMQRPCLIIRVRLAAALTSNGQAQFVRAVVSQVEYGVLNLLAPERPQMTVLLDCEGLSPFGFPVTTFRSCAILLQDHYPNRLGSLLVVRLPSVARVITQTLFQVLKPRTRRKLMIVGEDYRAVLSRYFEDLPPFLGGNCSCSKCSNEAETVGKMTSIDFRDHRLNGSSSDFERCVGSSLDTNQEHVKIVVAGSLLVWLCVVFILAVYYHQLVFPQLYYRTGS